MPYQIRDIRLYVLFVIEWVLRQGISVDELYESDPESRKNMCDIRLNVKSAAG